LTGTESNCIGLLATIQLEYGTSITYANALKEILGVLVNVELASLGVLAEVESGDLGNVLILTLTLLLLELEGDTANRATLDTLHPIELKKKSC
jgi:predicted membrane protein